MQRLLFHFLFCFGLSLAWAHENAIAKSSTPVQIAIVRDGPSELVPELRELIRRFIGDAALLGFTLPELIDQLRNEEKK